MNVTTTNKKRSLYFIGNDCGDSKLMIAKTVLRSPTITNYWAEL